MRSSTRLSVVVAVAGGLLAQSGANAQELRFTLQRQVETSPGSGLHHTIAEAETWDPRRTAIIICDVWDLHHCLNAVKRAEELAPRLNEVVGRLREQGVTVIHAPSDCMEAYADHPARRRALDTPPAPNLPPDIQAWCNRIPSEEQAVYPIDQSDGGEDDDPAEHAAWAEKLAAMGRNPKMPWRAQTDLIAINEGVDFISDKGDEVWSILEARGIRNVILAGVHTNMCVLGRPFGLRQMARNGRHVVLMRDMTDTMYNPAMWPYVSHFEGTDRIISHIERCVCPTIASDQVLGGEPIRFRDDTRPRIAVLMSEDEYETERTLTYFCQQQLGRNFATRFIYGRAEDVHDLPGLEAIDDADVLLVSVRRRALPQTQLDRIRRFAASGRPMIGLRTASHAFSLRDGSPQEGRAVWPEFDAEVWGGHYTGHHGNALDTTVTPAADAAPHPILNGIGQQPFASGGSLYKAAPLAAGATLLATGQVDGHPAEPVAWTFQRADGGRSFYTSLGHRSDFENPRFLRLLRNALDWATDRAPSDAPLAEPVSFRGRWTPLRLPAAEDILARLSTDNQESTWLRCGLRLPGGALAADGEWRLRGAGSEVWLNGEPCAACPDLADCVLLPESADREDSNLLVVRLSSRDEAGRVLARPPVLAAVESSGNPETAPVSLAGGWEMRIGENAAWSQPDLPAKFALPVSIYFELPERD
ncbi:MAG: isochorismatase family protein [Planctomyces sp.]|nr:isochorismatase family protein [Planctomyces sp.]